LCCLRAVYGLRVRDVTGVQTCALPIFLDLVEQCRRLLDLVSGEQGADGLERVVVGDDLGNGAGVGGVHGVLLLGVSCGMPSAYTTHCVYATRGERKSAPPTNP